MDELVEILDSEGNYTGDTALKSEAHKKGWFHPTVHIWFFTEDGNVLIQQRAENKNTFPLLWDVSVAGHIAAGEKIVNAAVREVKEEIGVRIAESDLQKTGIFKAVHKHQGNLMDCEFHHVFIARLKVPLNSLILQKSEVAAVRLVPILQFSEETWGLANVKKYVPHGAEYYKTVVKAIMKCLA